MLILNTLVLRVDFTVIIYVKGFSYKRANSFFGIDLVPTPHRGHINQQDTCYFRMGKSTVKQKNGFYLITGLFFLLRPVPSFNVLNLSR